jgi:hypothetical protein
VQTLAAVVILLTLGLVFAPAAAWRAFGEGRR